MLVGFLGFIILLFLPGLTLIQLLGVRMSLMENLALGFGSGCAILLLLLILLTSGFSVSGQLLLGVLPGTLALIIGASAAGLLGGIVFRHNVAFFVRPSRSDFILALILAAEVLLVSVHFAEYPIFPEFTSVDFTQHIMITTSLQSGVLPSVPGGVLYYGADEIMAAFIALSPDPALIGTQVAMAVLVVFSPLLVYSATKALGDSERAGLAAAAVYVLGGFIWFGSVFNAGLFANFYGLLSALFIIVAASIVLKEPQRFSLWVIYVVSVVNAYFSHYSTLTIVPALVALPILGFLFTRKVEKSLLVLAVVPLVPVIAVGLADPSLVNTLLSFVSASGGANITGDTFLSQFFSWSPFVRYVVVEITSDSASVFILAMAALGIYSVFRLRRPIAWLPLVWLVSIAVVAPQSESAWRFSYVALTPLVILASMGFVLILPIETRVPLMTRRGKRPTVRRRNRLVLASIVLVLMVAGSWGTTMLADAATNARTNGQAQSEVYRSMVWFANNTPADSKLVSVTDSNYKYLGLLTGRNSAYAPLVTASDLLSQVKNQKDVYVALTKVATLAANESQGRDLLISYSTNPAFTLRYNNSDVSIYSVNST